VIWRATGEDDRHVALLWCAVSVGVCLLGPFWLAAAPFVPPCAMRVLTGLPCPGCGTTRAVTSLLHGRVLAALALNPLAAAAGLVFTIGGLVAPLWVARGARVPVLPRPLPASWRVAAPAVLAANWAYLILHRH
jgi:hypothetical protein